MHGYTDQTGPDGLYTRYPLKYFSALQPPEHYDSDAVLPRIHAVEVLGEPQYGGGKRGSPTPDELRLQAYHGLSSRITSLYWFNLSLRSLVTFPDLIEPMIRVVREIRMLEDYYLEGDATSHQRMLRDGKLDWDLDVVAGPSGGLLFALDLAYEADLEQRAFQFGPPREAVFRFPLPAYLNHPAAIFRVDADGVAQVEHTVENGAVEIRDRVSRVAIYVVSMKSGESQRLESLRKALVATTFRRFVERHTVQFSFNRDAEQRWALSTLPSRLTKTSIFAPQSARAATKLPSLNGIVLS